MRTCEEIAVDAQRATDISDTEALLRYAAELDDIGTMFANAMASTVRGTISRLHGDFTTALDHNNTALALYEELDNRKGLAAVTGNIGIIYNSIGDYHAALEQLHRSLSLYNEFDDRDGAARVTTSIGNTFIYADDFPAALEQYHRALALHEENDDRGGMALVTGNIGTVHMQTGDYPTALECYYRALPMHTEIGNRRGIAVVTGNIGIVLERTGDLPGALEHYQRALSLHEELGDNSSAARVIANIGAVHATNGDHEAALEHFRRALALFEEIGEHNGVVFVTGNILALYMLVGSDAEAQALLDTMDTMQIPEPDLRVEHEQRRASLQERNGDLDGAALTLQHALLETHEHGLRRQTAEIHMSLRDLALKRNDLAAYVEHNNEFTRITEEINGKEITLKLAMQAKQREIDAHEKEIAKQLAVLHSALPEDVADRVARGEVVNDSFENAAVLFLDIVGSTSHSSHLDAGTVVELLQSIFIAFDAICADHNVMKIKTIGDAYMAVAFPSENHIADIVATACAMRSQQFTWPHSDEPVMFRIGMHVGPLIAGVIGTARMQYDVWGDTVNVASRMESHGEPGRIHVSESFAAALRLNDSMTNDSLTLFKRGQVAIKGKGEMTTYWLE